MQSLFIVVEFKQTTNKTKVSDSNGYLSRKVDFQICMGFLQILYIICTRPSNYKQGLVF